MLTALAHHNLKTLLLSTNQPLFFTTATIFSSVLYVDYDFHNNLFMEVFVGRFSISSIYFDETLTVSKNYIIDEVCSVDKIFLPEKII